MVRGTSLTMAIKMHRLKNSNHFYFRSLFCIPITFTSKIFSLWSNHKDVHIVQSMSRMNDTLLLWVRHGEVAGLWRWLRVLYTLLWHRAVTQLPRLLSKLHINFTSFNSLSLVISHILRIFNLLSETPALNFHISAVKAFDLRRFPIIDSGESSNKT